MTGRNFVSGFGSYSVDVIAGVEYQGHYGDVIMGAMVTQITSVSILYSTVCSGADQRKHQSPTSQKASNAENVSIWWCHHATGQATINTLGAVSIRKTVLPGMAIPMLKIPYVDKTVFILRRGPGALYMPLWDGLLMAPRKPLPISHLKFRVHYGAMGYFHLQFRTKGTLVLESYLNTLQLRWVWPDASNWIFSSFAS